MKDNRYFPRLATTQELAEMSIEDQLDYYMNRRRLVLLKGGLDDGLDWIRARIKRARAKEQARRIQTKQNVKNIIDRETRH